MFLFSYSPSSFCGQTKSKDNESFYELIKGIFIVDAYLCQMIEIYATTNSVTEFTSILADASKTFNYISIYYDSLIPSSEYEKAWGYIKLSMGGLSFALNKMSIAVHNDNESMLDDAIKTYENARLDLVRAMDCLPQVNISTAQFSGLRPSAYSKDEFYIGVSLFDEDGDAVLPPPMQLTDYKININSQPDIIMELKDIEIKYDSSKLGKLILLGIDESASMQQNDPYRKRVNAAKALVNLVKNENDCMLVFGFGRSYTSPYAYLLCEPTNDPNILLNAINNVQESGEKTPYYSAINDILSVCQKFQDAYEEADIKPQMFFITLTDGLSNDGPYNIENSITLSQKLNIPQ